jgi:hypothetical protein
MKETKMLKGTTEYRVVINGTESIEHISTYTTAEECKVNSMSYQICRYENINKCQWEYFYRGKRAEVRILKKAA